MTKKILVAFAILLCGIFASTYVFANNDMQKAGESVRNVVGGAENAVEGAAKGVTDTVRNGLNNAGNATQNTVNNMNNGINNAGNATRTTTNNNADGYSATRTATNGNFAGMNGTVWTWVILAIVGIAIIGLVWYYAMQNNNSTMNNDR